MASVVRPSVSRVEQLLGRHVKTGCFINGQWSFSALERSSFAVVNPTTEEVLAEVGQAGAHEVEMAVSAARCAFEGVWASTSGYKRSHILHSAANLLDLQQNTDSFALIEALEVGKPVEQVTKVDIPLATQCLRYFAGLADKIEGTTVPIDSNRHFVYTSKEPVGVCAQIIPWNFPTLMAIWKIAPALASGCTTIVKPSEHSPLSALLLAEIFEQAGLPPGVLNVLTGGASVGKLLTQHEGVDKIAFTGSTSAGKDIMSSSAGSLKRITLELGGKSPNIVLPDADIKRAIQGAHFGLFYNQGQVCTAGSRVFVPKGLYSEFVEKSAMFASKITVGDPTDPKTFQGPQVSSRQKQAVERYVQMAVDEGASIVPSVDERVLPEKGYFVAPTVLADCTDDMKSVQEEIFGPVMCVLPYGDIDEVIQRANNTAYGLAAGVWTSDISLAHYVSSKLRAGTVWVNCYGTSDSAMPFGGFKQSGIGRELGKEGMSAYLETKTVCIDIGKK